MKSLLKNLEKRDVEFFIALSLFAVLIVFRCFGGFMNLNPEPFGTLILDTKKSCATILYFCILLLFYFVSILKTDKKKKKDIYYVITFLSMFTFPMFVEDSYFGNKEILAWVLLFFSIMFIIYEKAEWITIPAVLLMAYLCPISVFCCVCIILALLLYQYFSKNQIRYLIYAVVNFISAAGVFLFQYSSEGFETDARFDLTFTKFIVICVLMSPYLLIAFAFFREWIKKVKGKKTVVGCVTILLGILPSIVVDLYIKDYSKTFFHVCAYFVLIVMCLFVMKEKNVVSAYKVVKEKIIEWVPIPSVVLLYPLIFMIMWVCGFIQMPVETVVGL